MAQTYKVSVCSAGDPGSNPGWRSLVGYNPWGQKELDTTERLHLHFFTQSKWDTGVHWYPHLPLQIHSLPFSSLLSFSGSWPAWTTRGFLVLASVGLDNREPRHKSRERAEVRLGIFSKLLPCSIPLGLLFLPRNSIGRVCAYIVSYTL